MVYIVTSGNYDEYKVHGAFTDISHARAYARREDADIEVWDGENFIRRLAVQYPFPRPEVVVLENVETIETPFGNLMIHNSGILQ